MQLCTVIQDTISLRTAFVTNSDQLQFFRRELMNHHKFMKFFFDGRYW